LKNKVFGTEQALAIALKKFLIFTCKNWKNG